MMFETFTEYSDLAANGLVLIKEDLIALSNFIESKKGYDVDIKNFNALNSDDELTSLVVKVNRGNIQKLIERITSIYNFRAEVDSKSNTVIFSKI